VDQNTAPGGVGFNLVRRFRKCSRRDRFYKGKEERIPEILGTGQHGGKILS